MDQTVWNRAVVFVVAAVSLTVLAHVAIAQPVSCTTGTDPKSGDEWVVCKADTSGAWLSTKSGSSGTYHATEICRELGYQGLGKFGDTVGSECGVDESSACDELGTESFNGNDACGSDTSGQILCGTVQWQCLGPFAGQTVRAPALSPAILCMLVGLLTVLGVRSLRRHA